MSFRKRNIVIPTSSSSASQQSLSSPAPSSGSRGSGDGASLPTSVATTTTISQTPTTTSPGIRPSPLSGIPTTSTGTPTLDGLLGGHAGLPLGTSLFIEENSTTDFAGALLRYYAAEGLVQGHKVIIVGAGEGWARELPGVTGAADGSEDGKQKGKKDQNDRMKIAWRYEGLGQFGHGIGGSRGMSNSQPTN